MNKLSDKYIFIKKIGNGSFGEVYMVEDKSGKSYAVKTESNLRNSKLPYEFKTYKYLRENGFRMGIPRIYNFIESPDYNIMVMQLMGESLEDLFNKSNRKFQLNTVLLLGNQLTTLLQTLHTAELLHRDIKPNNFLIGKKDPNNIYIMDFGLSKRYIRKGEHIPFKTGKSLVGTTRYASINIHNGFEPSRRDELESIGYMLIYFLKGKLPWQGLLKKSSSNNIKIIGDAKINTTLEELCNGIHICFYKYIKYCRELRFEQEPDYDYIRKLFDDACHDLQIKPYFEWCL